MFEKDKVLKELPARLMGASINPLNPKGGVEQDRDVGALPRHGGLSRSTLTRLSLRSSYAKLVCWRRLNWNCELINWKLFAATQGNRKPAFVRFNNMDMPISFLGCSRRIQRIEIRDNDR